MFTLPTLAFKLAFVKLLLASLSSAGVFLPVSYVYVCPQRAHYYHKMDRAPVDCIRVDLYGQADPPPIDLPPAPGSVVGP